MFTCLLFGSADTQTRVSFTGCFFFASSTLFQSAATLDTGWLLRLELDAHLPSEDADFKLWLLADALTPLLADLFGRLAALPLPLALLELQFPVLLLAPVQTVL